MVENLPVMQEVWVRSLGWKDLLEEVATHSSILAERVPWTEDWWATVQGVANSWTRLSVWAQHIEYGVRVIAIKNYPHISAA